MVNGDDLPVFNLLFDYHCTLQSWGDLTLMLMGMDNINKGQVMEEP